MGDRDPSPSDKYFVCQGRVSVYGTVGTCIIQVILCTVWLRQTGGYFGRRVFVLFEPSPERAASLQSEGSLRRPGNGPAASVRASTRVWCERCRGIGWPRGVVLGAFRYPRGGQAFSLTLAPHLGRTGRNRNLAESPHACRYLRHAHSPAQRTAVREISSRLGPCRWVNPASAGSFGRDCLSNRVGRKSATGAGCHR